MNEQRNGPRSFKYFLTVFFIVSISLSLYGIFAHRNTELTYVEWVLTYAYIPFFITIVAVIFNVIFSGTRRRSPEYEMQKRFVLHMSKLVKEKLSFQADDFKQMRGNDDFQDKMYYAYMLYTKGETEEIKFAMMLEGLDEVSVEYKAAQLISEEVERLKQEDITL